MDLVEKATLVAITAHEAVGQKRKFSNEPYWHHPAAVADMVSRYSDDESLIAAGWLHDVVEDTHIDLEHIRSHFNSDCARYVEDVTKQQPYGEDNNRNDLFEIKRLMGISSKSRLLKLCDIHCNIKDMNADCGFLFISEWLPKKFAMLLAIKQTAPEHDKLVDDTIRLARAMVNTYYPRTSVVRLFGNGVNLLGKAMFFNPEEESDNAQVNV